jgi:hypothetical protein
VWTKAFWIRTTKGAMSSDEIKLLKEQVKSLENQLKNYENQMYLLQSDIQYSQRAFQMEQSKTQNQVNSLASLILENIKESRQYEEAKESSVMQKVNSIMSSGEEYVGLNMAANTGVNTSTLTNDTNSLINGTIASLANTSTHQQNGAATAILPSSSRMTSNNQLLASTAIPQGQLLSQGSSHQSQTMQQLQQANHMAAVQQSFQQMQQQSRQQSRLQLQQQRQHQHQHQQQRQQLHQHQQHQRQQQQQQQQQQQIQMQQQEIHPHQISSHSEGHGNKRQKTNSSPHDDSTTDPSSILDDPLAGVNPVSVNSSRHLSIGLASTAQSDSSDESSRKERKIYEKMYSFIKAPTSVEEIWNEYAIGLNGQPSIKSLEIEYRTGWRRDAATSKKFNRRKAIYHAIEKGMSKGYTVDECIRLLEDYRYLDREKNLKQPIGWLCHGNIPSQLK